MLVYDNKVESGRLLFDQSARYVEKQTTEHLLIFFMLFLFTLKSSLAVTETDVSVTNIKQSVNKHKAEVSETELTAGVLKKDP